MDLSASSKIGEGCTAAAVGPRRTLTFLDTRFLEGGGGKSFKPILLDMVNGQEAVRDLISSITDGTEQSRAEQSRAEQRPTTKRRDK